MVMSSILSILWYCSVPIGLIRMGASTIMKNIFHGAEPPWGSKVKWQIVNRDLAYLIRRHYVALKNAMKSAWDLEAGLASIFPFLDDLCRATCPWCPTPCCLTARAWIDFKDLLFLHLGGHPIPPEQLLPNLKEICRYWSLKGCVLPRMSRAWVCTWYLCPTQKANLRQKTRHTQDNFSRLIQAVKTCRTEMEAEFIRIVCGG